MVRDRQHAVGPHRQGLGPGGRHRVGDGAGGLRGRPGRRRPRRRAARGGRPRGGPEPGADPVPRRRRRRADPEVRGDPPPPSPGGPGGHRLDRRRAAPARRAARPRRPGDRHRGAQHQPAPDPADGGVRQRGAGGHHAHLGRLLRVQARGAPRRRPDVRLPVPPQSLLERAAAGPQRARRGGPGLRARPAGDHRVPRQARGPLPHADPRLHPGGEVLPDGGHGLHRGPAPIGGPGRGDVPPARATTACPPPSSTGTSTGERTAGRRHRRGPRPGRHPAGRPPVHRPR